MIAIAFLLRTYGLNVLAYLCMIVRLSIANSFYIVDFPPFLLGLQHAVKHIR